MFIDAHGTQYEAMQNFVGYKVTKPDGVVSYLYFNPSSESDDGVSNVFVYQGPHGEPGDDTPVCFLDV